MSPTARKTPPKHPHAHPGAHRKAPPKRAPRPRSPYRPIPPHRRGPGKLTGGYHVILQAWTVNLKLTALLGPNGGRITGGLGGNWTAVDVPRGAPLTTWTGRSLLAMDLDLWLEGYSQHRRSVEHDIHLLEQLAQTLPGGDTPPSLRIFGAVPWPRLRWVITGVDYGDVIRRKHDGQRLRQLVTVHLLEYRDPNAAFAHLPRAEATAKPPRKYKVKHGDDLKKIAAALLGKSARWEDIDKLNTGLRGWRIPAKWVGKTIKVPAK